MVVMVLLMCSTINQLRLYHTSTGVTFLNLNKGPHKRVVVFFFYFSLFFFFFCMLKYSMRPWTDSHCFLLSLDLLLVSHLDTSLIFLSEYGCSMTKVV